MNNNIFPCLWFNGDGKEAADFYCETFGGKITADTPVVLNIELFGQKLMFLNAGPQFEKNASISFTILCETENELHNYWKQLSQNGTVIKDLGEYSGSKLYGSILDQFGVTWQLYLSEIQNDQKIIPTLTFAHQNNGKAKAAIEFYTSIFPHSKIGRILKYGDKVGNDHSEISGNVQHADFKIDDYSLFVLDRSDDQPFDFNEGISIVVMTDDQIQTDHLWDSLLINGGRASMCGWLKDQFGISWQIVPKRLLELMNDFDQPAKAQKVVEAMMSMQKIEIETLETAYHS